MQIGDWMAATGRDDASLAREANVTRATISRIRRGKQRPSNRLATALIRLSGGQVGLAELFGISEEAA
jgi:DNA-binding XRE family transcriptional regulator